MLRIIWLQFTHSLKTWTLTLLLFVVTGFLVGTCLNAICTIADHYPHLSKSINPSGGFYYPLIFGIATILIISSGVVRLVISSSEKEYTLWTILGANPNQLSLLIGGQLTLVGALGSLIGFILSVPFMTSLDAWYIISLEGSTLGQRVPALPITFSFSACLLTIGIMSITSGLAGYLHSHVLFVNHSNNGLAFAKNSSIPQTICHRLLVIISAISLMIYYANSLVLTPQAEQYIRIEEFHKAGKTYIMNLMLIILLAIFLISSTSQFVLPKLIKIWTRILPRKASPTLNVAFWNILFDKNYLSSLISPLIAGSFMLTGITYIASEITNGGSNEEAETNLRESIIIFVGTPLLIILINVLTIIIITSTQKRKDIAQLSLLGFTPKELVIEKFHETIIYSTTFFIYSVISNIPMYLLIKRIVTISHKTMNSPLTTIITYPAWLYGIITIFIITVGIFQVAYVSKRSKYKSPVSM